MLFFTFSLRCGTPVSIRGLTDNQPGTPFLSEHGSVARSDVDSEGIFERFVRNYIFMLSTAFFPKDLIKYLRIVEKELRKMEFTYTEKLANKFKSVIKMDRDEALELIASYQEEYDGRSEVIQEFLEAMNEVFTMQQNQQFDDYIQDLKEYASSLKLTIRDETRKLLNDVIVNNIDKLSEHDKRELERKLRHAIKDYRNYR